MGKAKTLLVLFVVLVLIAGVQSLWAGGQKPAAEQQTYNIRIGHSNMAADNSALHVTGMVFEELIEEYSDGRIQAEIYPNAQLGNDSEMADLVVSGALDAFVTSINLVTNYAPRLRAVILPYMFENNTDFRKAREALWDDFNDYCIRKANMRLITMWDSGYRHVMSRSPVNQLSDLKKLKFRVPPSPIMVEMVKSWGISPTPVEWSELFNAMQLGVVDAFEVDDSVLISARMNEVVKYITNNDHILQVSVLMMSEETYKKLPPDLQKAVDRASKDSMPRVDARSAAILEEAVEVSKKEHGVQFLGRPKDYEEWARLARGSWSVHYKDIGEGDAEVGKAFVEKVFAAAGM
jgi:tripartite ATP-independent transporter DctP family solute receptor